MSRPSQVRPALAADTQLAPLLVVAHADAGRDAARAAHDGHRGGRDRHELVDHAALHGRPGGLGVALGHMHALHDDPALGRHGPDHVGLLPPVLAREHLDLVALLDTHLEHLRRQRDDPHEALVAQFPADGTEDAGPPGLLLIVDEDGGIFVEADVAAVGTALLLLRPDDDALDDVALLDRSPRDGVLDRGHEDVPDRGVATARAA